MSEYDYDENWAPDLLAAGITPHYDPLDTRGLLAQIIENLGGGGGGSIEEITSDDDSITVTDPTGPTTDLSVNALGAGTVTSVSVVSANGLAGTVATATTTPAITLSTTVTGLLKGDGTAISAATAGTDYLAGPLTGDVTTSGEAATLVATTAVQNIIRTYRAALSGDVTASQDSNATTLVATSAVQGIVRSYRAALTGDATASQDSNATTVVALNGTTLSALATGLLKNTTGTGVPSIATAGTDYPATGVIVAGGPTGSGTAVPVVTYNANGQLTVVTTVATVGSVAATDSSIVVGGTGTAPTIQRAALSGDVTASAGSNATALQNTTAVQAVVQLNPVTLVHQSVTFF